MEARRERPTTTPSQTTPGCPSRKPLGKCCPGGLCLLSPEQVHSPFSSAKSTEPSLRLARNSHRSSSHLSGRGMTDANRQRPCYREPPPPAAQGRTRTSSGPELIPAPLRRSSRISTARAAAAAAISAGLAVSTMGPARTPALAASRPPSKFLSNRSQVLLPRNNLAASAARKLPRLIHNLLQRFRQHRRYDCSSVCLEQDIAEADVPGHLCHRQ